MICNKLTECLNCSSYGGDMFYYLRLLENYRYRQYRFKKNCLLFLLQGEIRIDGLHFPDIRIESKQLIVLPAGVELDIHILADSHCLLYHFTEPPVLCEDQYEKILLSGDHGPDGCLLEMLPPILNFAQGIVQNLEQGLLCRKFLEMKEKEIVFLINSYYPYPQLITFLAPVFKTLNHFRCFVLQNYYKVKTVEELALLGKYGLVTFRRLFKEEFGEPAYQWMIRQRKEQIYYDLIHRELSISAVADKYLFESLPQFSNFCKKYFGASPRAIQNKHCIKSDNELTIDNEK